MVVIGIVAILMGVAAFQLTQSRRRVTLERALFELHSRLLHAQSLAAVAGSRLGVGRVAPRLVHRNGCTVDPAPQLWVRINGSTVELPAQLEYDDAADTLFVDCDTVDVTAITQTNGVLNEPTAAVVFAFLPSGRTVVQGGPPAPVYIEVGSAGDPKTYGLRILPSGVICPASTLGGALCDEEVGP